MPPQQALLHHRWVVAVDAWPPAGRATFRHQEGGDPPASRGLPDPTRTPPFLPFPGATAGVPHQSPPLSSDPCARYSRLTTAALRGGRSCRWGQPRWMYQGVAQCVCARKRKDKARDSLSMTAGCCASPPPTLRSKRGGTYPGGARVGALKRLDSPPPLCIFRSRMAMRGMQALAVLGSGVFSPEAAWFLSLFY